MTQRPGQARLYPGPGSQGRRGVAYAGKDRGAGGSPAGALNLQAVIIGACDRGQIDGPVPWSWAAARASTP